jgi:hypothetical protein
VKTIPLTKWIDWPTKYDAGVPNASPGAPRTPLYSGHGKVGSPNAGKT